MNKFISFERIFMFGGRWLNSFNFNTLWITCN